MANRLVDTEIWKKDWFLELSDKQKLLTKFLFDNCDCAGFYKISWNLLKCFFNELPKKEDFEKIKQVKFIEDDLIFIEDFALFQCKVNSFYELNPKNNAHLGVLKLLKKHGVFLSPSLAPSEPLTSPCPGAQEKEKEKEKEKDKDKEKEKEKEEEIKIDTTNVEPDEEELENPIRILPLQRKVISELNNNDYEPIIHGRYSGFVMLKKKNPNVIAIYDADFEEEKKEEKKPEEKKDDKPKETKGKDEGYKSLPQEDFDIPEDFDLDKAK